MGLNFRSADYRSGVPKKAGRKYALGLRYLHISTINPRQICHCSLLIGIEIEIEITKLPRILLPHASIELPE